MCNDTPDTPQKQCTKCGEWKPATPEYWYNQKSSIDGLAPQCKTCRQAYDKWRREYPEEFEAQKQRKQELFDAGLKQCSKCNEIKTLEEFHVNNRAYDKCASRCKNCVLDDFQNSYWENPQKYRERSRKWYSQNSDTALEQSKHWRENNPEKARSATRRWRENNPERVRRTKRLWYKNNPDRVKAMRLRRRNKQREYNYNYYWNNVERERNRVRKYAKNNPEKVRATGRRWRENNPEKVKQQQQKYAKQMMINTQRYRARKRNLADTFTLQNWRLAIDYFNGCCAVCGRQLSNLFGEHTAAQDHWIPLSSSDCPGTIPENIVPLCHGIDGCNNSKGAKDPEVWLIETYGQRKAKQILDRIHTYFEWVKDQSD